MPNTLLTIFNNRQNNSRNNNYFIYFVIDVLLQDDSILPKARQCPQETCKAPQRATRLFGTLTLPDKHITLLGALQRL